MPTQEILEFSICYGISAMGAHFTQDITQTTSVMCVIAVLHITHKVCEKLQ